MTQDWLKILGMWNWEPSILLGIALFLGLYLAAIGPLRGRFKASSPVRNAQSVYFIMGTFSIFLALVSPLDELGDTYLFSAHMLQHAILVFVAPPLLLAGTPNWLADALISPRLIRPIARVLTYPITAYFLFNLVFAGWHLPALYEAALENQNIHIFEHLSFLFTALFNWWPVLSPSTLMGRLSYPAQMLYLFLESIPSTILGAVISFAPNILYPTYSSAPAQLGISPMLDQQIAGLIMAMPAAMAYLVVLTVVFFSWSKKEEHGALKQSG